MSAVLLAAAVLGPAVLPQDSVPRYERAECAFERGEWVEGANLECGVLFVLEDPLRRESPVLRLPVAILRAKEPGSKPPLVMLHGGPGLTALGGMIRGVAQSGMARDRDVVLYDQRGAGLAEPVLCPDFQVEDYERDDAGARERFRARARACVESIRRDGGDPAMYHTRNSALDLAALRRALGYSVWDIWGESYGGRLAAEAMRTDPDGIRSVVLSRPVPHGSFRAERAKAWRDAFTVVFDACAADRRCAAAFPKPEEDLQGLFEQLARSPVLIDVVDGGATRLDGGALVHALVRLARAPSGVAWIPFLLDEMGRGDFDRATRHLMGRSAGRGTPGRVSFWLVECADVYGPGFQVLQDSVEAMLPTVFHVQRPLECDVWQDGFASEEAMRPVSSDIPTLILTAQFDPVTPPEFGHRIAATLSNAYVYELPGESHSSREVTDCHRSLVDQFWSDPTRAPDASCIDGIPPIEFVTSWPEQNPAGGGAAADGGPARPADPRKASFPKPRWKTTRPARSCC